jgi:8-oxo-dGTP pyrophosphatase MutT (NUDIX family)
LLEGAVRECWEETGYRFSPGAEGPLLATESFFFLRSQNRYCHSLAFTVTGTVEDRPDPAWRTDPQEIVTVAWVPVSTLSQESVYAMHWDALRHYQLV